MTDVSLDLMKLYPDGRTFYYEGRDSVAADFVEAMQLRGHRVTITVHVDAEKLESFERERWQVGT